MEGNQKNSSIRPIYVARLNTIFLWFPQLKFFNLSFFLIERFIKPAVEMIRFNLTLEAYALSLKHASVINFINKYSLYTNRKDA